jgi:hypothetical protein
VLWVSSHPFISTNELNEWTSESWSCCCRVVVLKERGKWKTSIECFSSSAEEPFVLLGGHQGHAVMDVELPSRTFPAFAVTVEPTLSTIPASILPTALPLHTTPPSLMSVRPSQTIAHVPLHNDTANRCKLAVRNLLEQGCANHIPR